MEFKLEQTFQNARNASRTLIEIPSEEINNILIEIADKAVANTDVILKANQKDLDRMDKNDPKYDRLLLDADRITGIAGDIKNVARLESPIGKLIENKVLDNGLDISRIKVPIGVIGVIYEARPNVSFDVFAICFKTQNACILKGGSDAEFSNIAIVNIIKEVLKNHNINTDVVTLLPADRSATTEMLNAVKYVDVIIPRGSQGLINYVRENAKVPVIETGAGIVHIYFDKDGDIKKGTAIIANSKTRRVSVCNALDCLLIHESQLGNLNKLSTELASKGTIIYADEKSFAELTDYPKDLLNKAEEAHFGTEFLANTMSIKTVANIDEALNHIAKYSSKHSESIISENAETIAKYLNVVDAAAVYANASTAFTDGAQFGLGAEIGISTQKLHARGPMGLDEITSYKWVIKGNGQTRS